MKNRYLLLSSILVVQVLSTSALAQGLTPAEVAKTSQTTTTAAAKKSMDLKQMEMIAQRAAETFAADVLEVVGGAYQIRNSIVDGIESGLRQYGDYNDMNVTSSTSEYSRSFTTGSANGSARGQEAGAQAAISKADSMALQDIEAAVDVAIDNKSKINFKANPRVDNQFSGIEASISQPESFTGRLLSAQSAVQSEARRNTDSRMSSSSLSSIFDMRSMIDEAYQNYRQNSAGLNRSGQRPGLARRTQVTPIPEYLRGDQAYNNWSTNLFRTSSSTFTQAKSFLTEVTNSSVYENTEQNARIFKQTLIAAYSRAIENAWTQKTHQPSASLERYGRDLYLEKANIYAAELGNYNGYKEEFRPASIDQYMKRMSEGKDYASSFAKYKSRVENNSLIGSEVVRITSEEGLSELTLGDTIDIYVDSLTNRGMKKGSVVLVPQASSQITVLGKGGAIEVNGLTRKEDSTRFQRQLWISDVTAADQQVQAVVRLGDKTFTQNFKLTFEAMIRRVAQNRDARISEILIKKIVQNMKAQYDDMSGFKDQYKERKPDRYLVRMLNVFHTLSDGDKNELRKHGQLIRDAFGGKPSKFLNPKRNEWDEVQKIIGEMSLSGGTPEKSNDQPQNNNNWNDPAFGAGG